MWGYGWVEEVGTYREGTRWERDGECGEGEGTMRMRKRGSSDTIDASRKLSRIQLFLSSTFAFSLQHAIQRFTNVIIFTAVINTFF